MRERERRFQAFPALRQEPVDLPETAYADDEAQCRLGVFCLEGVCEGGAQIVMFVLHADEPLGLIAARQAGFGFLRECHEVVEMPAAGLVVLAERAQSLEGVVADELQQGEAGLVRLALRQETLVDESCEA